MARFIFITGGVVSSLGKGLASAALGALFMGLLITFFTLKNLADAGLYADLINAIKVRDWIAFAGLLTLVAAIKILVVVEDRED